MHASWREKDVVDGVAVGAPAGGNSASAAKRKTERMAPKAA